MPFLNKCDNLASVNITDSITIIEIRSFRNCSTRRLSISIPDCVRMAGGVYDFKDYTSVIYI